MAYLCKTIKVNCIINESMLVMSNFSVPIKWTPGILASPFATTLEAWAKDLPGKAIPATNGLCRQFSTTFHWIDTTLGTAPAIVYQKERKLALFFADEYFNTVKYVIPGFVKSILVDGTTDQVDTTNLLVTTAIAAVKAKCVSIYGHPIKYFIRAMVVETPSTIGRVN